MNEVVILPQERNNIHLFNTLKSIFLHLDNLESTVIHQYHLSIPRYYTLKHIRENPGISLNALTHKLLCTKSNTSRLVQSVVRKGYVERERSPEDARVLMHYITTEGAQLLEQVEQDHLDHFRNLFDPFGDDLETMLEVTRTIDSFLAKKTQQINLTQTK
jgi:DNA-binding MarR family transcriptional regulator